MSCAAFSPKVEPGVQNRPIAQVFENQQLLEMILGYALYDNYSQAVCRNNLLNFRLLSKCGDKAVLRILENASEALYTLTMTGSNSLTRKRKGRGKVSKKSILQKFGNFLNSCTPPDSYKGFYLKMEAAVFCLEVYDDFVRGMVEIGCNLVKLDLKIPENGGSFPGLLPNSLKFPALQILTVKFNDDVLKEEQSSNLAANVICLLQSLLHKSNNLKELNVKGWVPLEFQYIDLPETLTAIYFKCQENPKLLECLIRNRLPNLKKLRIWHCIYDETPLQKELLSRILQNCHKLDSLIISEFNYTGPPRIPLYLKFPVMENLKRLSLYGTQSELNGKTIALPDTFPKLTSISLVRHTMDMFLKWTSGSAAPLVTSFELELADEQKPDVLHMDDEKRYYNTLPIPVAAMQRVNAVFPNITKLCLFHSGTQCTALQFVFREMRQIRRLKIKAMATGPGTLGSSDHWDSLFIGALLELVVGLGACPSFWQNVKLDNKKEPSIKWLKELEYMYLEAELDDSLEYLISDLSFTYALNSMTKLRQARPIGRFLPSADTMRKWEWQNRTLEYYKN